MSAAYPDSIVIEYHNGSAWVNISAYVVGDIMGSSGLGGWKPDARVAVLGTLNLTLNNKAKLFSPMGGDAARGLNTLSGFNKGARVRVRVVYEGESHTVWSGRILSLDSDDKNWGDERTRLTAVDWMDIPANFNMKRATIALNKTMDSALALLLARFSVQPEATSIDAGAFVFPAVFDNVKSRTSGAAEFSKIAFSELGYIYIKGDGTLRAENYTARAGGRALDQVQLANDNAGRLLKEDGFYLLKEDGGKLVLNELEDAALTASMESHTILLDANSLLNAALVRAYPVITDTSAKALYTLGKSILLAGSQTVTFTAHYYDPSGYGQIAGTNMQAPVATTDYLANTAADGSGTDKTANITVSAVYYGDVVEYTITNLAAGNVYITKLQARGYGIYYGNAIETAINDAPSQAAYGYYPFQFEQRYQRDPYLGTAYALSVIEEYKSPKSRITKMKYLANLNSHHLMAFLFLGIGALISLLEDRSQITNHYYVTDQAFTIHQGGTIEVTYGLKQNDTLKSGALNPLSIDFSQAPGAFNATSDRIDFGQSPATTDLVKRSLSAWIYIDAGATSMPLTIIGKRGGGTDPRGFIFAISKTGSNHYLIYTEEWSTSSPSFFTAAGTITTGALHHVVATLDETNGAFIGKIYIDGVDTAISGAAATGTRKSDAAMALTLGAETYTTGGAFAVIPFEGKILDARIYNRILTQAEVTELYNSGSPDVSLVQSGLVFQAPNINADVGDQTSLTGHVLISTDRIIDNALHAIGIPYGAPVIRT